MLWKRFRSRKIHENNLVHDLLYATVSRDIERVDELIQCGINPCTKMEDGTSPIHKAAVMEPPHGPQIVSRMLSYGANPNVVTPTGLSPLHIAAMWGRVETINVLLDFGADVLLKDMDDMSALDYADEAEENRIQCIDALTRYRSTPRRKSNGKCGYFLSKSRYNLQKIIGSDLSFSDKDTSFKICENSEEKHDIFIEQEALFMQHHGKRKRKGLQKRFSFKRFPSINAAVQTDKIINTLKEKKTEKTSNKTKEKKTEKEIDSSFATYTEILDIDVPDGVPNGTVFHSCEEEINSFSKEDSKHFITSTFIEEKTSYGSSLSIKINSKREERGICGSSTGSSISTIDSSSDNSSSSNKSSSSNRSSSSYQSSSNPLSFKRCNPKNDKNGKSKRKSIRKKDKSNDKKSSSSSKDGSPVVTNLPQSKPASIENDINALANRLANIDVLQNFMTSSSENETKMLIPISLPSCNTKNCNVNINICITNSDKESDYDKKIETFHYDNQTKNMKNSTENSDDMKSNKVCEEIIPPPLEIETVEGALMDDVIERMEVSDEDYLSEEFISLNAQDLTIDGEIMGEATIELNIDPLDESTVDYVTHDKPVSDIVNYLHGKNKDKKLVTSCSTEEVISTYNPEKLLSANFKETFLPPNNPDLSATILNKETLSEMQRNKLNSLIHDLHESGSADETGSTIVANHSLRDSLHRDSEQLPPKLPPKLPPPRLPPKLPSKLPSQSPSQSAEELIPAYKISDLCSANEFFSHNGNRKSGEKNDKETSLISSQEKRRSSPVHSKTNSASSIDNNKSTDVRKDEKSNVSTDIAEGTPKSNLQSGSKISTNDNEKLFHNRDVKNLISPKKMIPSPFKGKNDDSLNVPNDSSFFSARENVTGDNSVIYECIDDNDKLISSNEMEKLFPANYVSKSATVQDVEKPHNIAETAVSAQFSRKKVNLNESRKSIPTPEISRLSPVHSKDKLNSSRDTDKSKASSNNSKKNSVHSKDNLSAPNNSEKCLTLHDIIQAAKLKVENHKPISKSGIPILVQKAKKLAKAQRNGSLNTTKDTEKSHTPKVTISDEAEYFESSEYYEESSCEEDNNMNEDSDAALQSFEEREKEFGCLDEVDQGQNVVPVVKITYKQRSLMDELSDIGVEYGWKDVCHNDILREFEKNISIPCKILTLHDADLKSRLTKVGVAAEHISDRTRKIYQKHLVKLEMSDHIVLKPIERYEDYTLEMANVFCGLIDISDETGELLEKDMALQFEHPEKHTWREGTRVTSFNYLLLDPRVTNDLPERAHKMSFLQAFKVFVASIYFVGRGRQCRPNEHLEEATKYVFRPPTNKIRMIHDIWGGGLGVISIPVFDNIIPVEAFTREACIIEAMGLSRLTNVKQGDFYGAAASWSIKKQRFLGIYLLMKAMKNFLCEGETQIRIKDIER